MPQAKVKALFEKTTNEVTMSRVQVKTLSCFLLLTMSLAYYFLCDFQIVHIQNGISIIKIENVAPPNSIKTADASEHLIDAHKSDYPSLAAGRWVYQPNGGRRYSGAHLKCLAVAIYANCWDTSSIPKKNQKGNRPRYDALQKGYIANSPGILNASDPYVWVSEDPAYRVINVAEKALIRRLVKGRRFFLIGDSLTNEWFHTLRCEFEHVLELKKKISSS
jgi:hypothetical protein